MAPLPFSVRALSPWVRTASFHVSARAMPRACRPHAGRRKSRARTVLASAASAPRPDLDRTVVEATTRTQTATACQCAAMSARNTVRNAWSASVTANFGASTRPTSIGRLQLGTRRDDDWCGSPVFRLGHRPDRGSYGCPVRRRHEPPRAAGSRACWRPIGARTHCAAKDRATATRAYVHGQGPGPTGSDLKIFGDSSPLVEHSPAGRYPRDAHERLACPSASAAQAVAGASHAADGRHCRTAADRSCSRFKPLAQAEASPTTQSHCCTGACSYRCGIREFLARSSRGRRPRDGGARSTGIARLI